MRKQIKSFAIFTDHFITLFLVGLSLIEFRAAYMITPVLSSQHAISHNSMILGGTENSGLKICHGEYLYICNTQLDTTICLGAAYISKDIFLHAMTTLGHPLFLFMGKNTCFELSMAEIRQYTRDQCTLVQA